MKKKKTPRMSDLVADERLREQFKEALYSGKPLLGEEGGIFTDLLKSCKSSTKDSFKLSSKIDLTENAIGIDKSLLHELFETGYNEYTLSEIKLNEEHEFKCKISLLKKKMKI